MPPVPHIDRGCKTCAVPSASGGSSGADIPNSADGTGGAKADKGHARHTAAAAGAKLILGHCDLLGRMLRIHLLRCR